MTQKHGEHNNIRIYQNVTNTPSKSEFRNRTGWRKGKKKAEEGGKELRTEARLH